MSSIQVVALVFSLVASLFLIYICFILNCKIEDLRTGSNYLRDERDINFRRYWGLEQRLSSLLKHLDLKEVKRTARLEIRKRGDV